jgi:hypothetical protein
MKKHYTIPILFKIDEQTLGKLDKAIDELGHTRSIAGFSTTKLMSGL